MSERQNADTFARALADALRSLINELVEEAIADRLSAPSVEWLTVEEYAQHKRTTPAAVQKRIERGRIPDAVREGGKRWLIPVHSPSDTFRDLISKGAGTADTAPP